MAINIHKAVGQLVALSRIKFDRNILRLNLAPVFCHRFSSNQNQDRTFDLSSFDVSKIRNFSIIAHIDHGKSTLADGILEHTGAIRVDAGNAQVLDKLRVERERGITVKAQTATMFYEFKGQTFLLNLIDTPGHVDFSFEVSRSLAACNGAVLLVDASQGVEAQTVANFWLAFERDLSVIGVLNKMDMPNAKPKIVEEQMKKLFDMEPSEILRVSAKLRSGVKEVLDAVVEKIGAPKGDPKKPLKALVFDSWFDPYKGCFAMVLIKDGSLKAGDEIWSLGSSKKHQVQQVGVLCPDPRPTRCLHAGQVGFFAANLRSVRDVMVGDTFCAYEHKNDIQPEEGFKPAKPVVFAGLYPVDAADFDNLKVAVERLCLNDPSVHMEPISSPALGLGFRVGFLGLLHMEVFTQRLDDEYDASTVLTAPTVSYVVRLKDHPTILKRYDMKSELLVNNPSKFPELLTDVQEYLEPMALCTIISPLEFYKAIEEMCDSRRGERRDSTMIDDDRVMLSYRFPLSNVIVDLVDNLKRASSGYASFDYELDGYEAADLVKLTVLLNGKPVDEFSSVVLRAEARTKGRELCRRMVHEIPRQLFEITIQAAAGSKILARENIRPITKNFAAKLKNNMDISRLGKLVSRQKEGKKRMKLIHQVQVPKEAFLNVLRRQ